MSSQIRRFNFVSSTGELAEREYGECVLYRDHASREAELIAESNSLRADKVRLEQENEKLTQLVSGLKEEQAALDEIWSRKLCEQEKRAEKAEQRIAELEDKVLELNELIDEFSEFRGEE
jgi:hypothetical protein